jgi:hypothetical protein
MKNSLRPPDDAILQAFLKVRDGWSAEVVVCDVRLNRDFVDACRVLGLSHAEYELNFRLFNLRKAGHLAAYPSSRRKGKGPGAVQKAASNAARFLERQFQTTVGRIICDPCMRGELDSLMAMFLPACPEFEARYAVLTLRKKSRLKPEPVGRIVRAVGGAMHPVLDLKIEEIPVSPGVYLFFDSEGTLYAGKADNLRRRIVDHLDSWLARDLIAQIREGKRIPVFLGYHVLKSDIQGLELGAYETEIIRSRSPQHYRAGKLPEEGK